MAWWDDLNAGQSIGPKPGSVEELRAAMSAQQAQQAKQSTAQPKKKQKNFWVDQISTLGGIVGGIGGSFVSPLAGTAAGAGLGSAFGEGLENILTGDPWNKNVAQEGALGAVFGAGPLKLGKAGLGMLAKRGATNAADDATRVVVGSAPDVAFRPLKTSFVGQMNNLGDKALTSQYGTIGKNVARQTNPAETISKLADYGIVKPKDAERVASSITGSSGLLTNAVSKAVEGAGNVQLSGLKGVLQDAITTHGLVDKEAKAVKAIFNAQINSIKAGGNTAPAVMKAMRNLEKRAANLQGKGGNYRLSTPERVDQANALLTVRNALQDRLYGVAGGNANLPKVLTPELRQKLINLQPKNENWRKFIDTEVMAAKDVGSLRNAQSPFVRIKNIIDEGDMNAMTFGGRVGNNGLNGGSVTNIVMNAAAENLKNPAMRTVAKPLRGIGKLPTGEITQSKKGIATRLGLLGALTSGDTADGAYSDPNIDNMIAPKYNTNTAINMPPATSNISQQYQNSNDLSSPYGKANLLYDIQRDPSNADQYIAYYKQLQEVFGGGGQPTYSSAVAGRIADTQKGLEGIQGLSNLINSPEYAGGVIQGGLRQFNPFDSQFKTQQAQIDAVRQFVGKALEGGVLRKEDEDKYRKILPTLQDDPQVANAKLQYLNQMIQRDLNNYTGLVGGGSSTSLQDIITQGGF